MVETHVLPALVLLVATTMPALVSGQPAGLTEHETILGVTAGGRSLAYVERARTPTGFVHVTVVETSADGAAPRRLRLTTDAEATRWDSLPAATREDERRAVVARVARDVEAARARYVPGSALTVQEASPATGCTRPPFAGRDLTIGPALTARLEVAPDGDRSSLALAQYGVNGAPESLPSSVLSTSTGGSQAVPYNRVLEAREVPGQDLVGVLVGSDACTPEGARVPARALVLRLPAPAGRPLAALPHAEASEREVLHLLAPRARRRSADDTGGFYDGSTRWILDNAWSLGSERFLVQVTARAASLRPGVAEAGLTPTSFALLERRHGRLAVLARAEARDDGPREGTGQEAFGVDLDGDGAVEVVLQTRSAPESEYTYVLHAGATGVDRLFTVLTRADARGTPGTEARATVRRCAVGLDGRALLVRCHTAEHATGAPAGTPPLTRSGSLQRVVYEGALLRSYDTTWPE